MNKKELMEFMEHGREKGLGVVLYLNIPKLPAKEQIGVPNINLKGKMNYINETYTDDLEYKKDTRIKIIDVCYIDYEDFDEEPINDYSMGINKDTKEMKY